MDIDISDLDQNLLGANRPYERMIGLYIQIYERMVNSLNQEITMADLDSMLMSLDKMIEYLSEITADQISDQFFHFRAMYLEMIQETIEEVEESLCHD